MTLNPPPQKKITWILNLWVLINCNVRYLYSNVFYFWVLNTCIFKCNRIACPTEIWSIYIDENNQTLLWLALIRLSILDVTYRNGLKSAKSWLSELKIASERVGQLLSSCQESKCPMVYLIRTNMITYIIYIAKNFLLWGIIGLKKKWRNFYCAS